MYGPVFITVLKLDACTRERNVNFPKIDSIFAKKCAIEVNSATLLRSRL